MDARLFKEILENNIKLEIRVKTLEALFISLQNETSKVQSVSKSRNISELDEKTAEIRSTKLGRKTHEEMCKELKINHGDRI